ncbi:MAG: hypothetical protein IBX72_03870 [Nitrospirae bacterium]|nr:hypothetical protein [Nitrospirota bacterium]
MKKAEIKYYIVGERISLDDGIIGVKKDSKDFLELIAQRLRREGEVSIIPLAKTRQELFSRIHSKTFEMENLVKAIRDLATLHEKEEDREYDPSVYDSLCTIINNLSDEIATLAHTADTSKEEARCLKPLDEKLL